MFGFKTPNNFLLRFVFFLFYILIFFLQKSFAITINQAIDSAIVNNKNIKYYDYKLQAQKAEKIGAAVGGFLPDVSANVHYGNKNNKVSNSNQSNSNKERYEEIKLEQSLFNGFGSLMKYREADYKYQSSMAQKTDKRQEIVMLAANIFCDFFLYQENDKIYKKNQELSEEILYLAKKRKNAGLLDDAEFVKYNYEAIEIKKQYLDNLANLNKARAEFKNIVGVDDEYLSEPQIEIEEYNKQKVLQDVLINNQNVKSSYYNYLSAKYNYHSQKSELSPKVSVVASASKQRNVVYLGQNDLNSQSVYLNFSVPIFQKGVEYSNISRAGHESSAAKEEYEIIKDNITKEVSKALDDYDLYLQLIESNEELSELAKNRLAIFKIRNFAKIEDKIEYLRTKIEYNNYITQGLKAGSELIKTHYKIKYFLAEL